MENFKHVQNCREWGEPGLACLIVSSRKPMARAASSAPRPIILKRILDNMLFYP